MSNANGRLTVNQLMASNISVVAMIATGNGGTTFLNEAVVTQSSSPVSKPTSLGAHLRSNIGFCCLSHYLSRFQGYQLSFLYLETNTYERVR